MLFIIAMSAPFGWVLIQQQVPNQILKALMTLSADPIMILLIINLILLFLGMFLETIAIMIITYPILAPVIAAIGIDPIHFGVIMVVNMMIGLVTPPVGLCLFVVSGIANVPIADIDQVWVGLKVARQGQCLSVGEDTITRLDGRAVRFDFVGMMSSEGFKTCDPAMMPVIAEIQNKN